MCAVRFIENDPTTYAAIVPEGGYRWTGGFSLMTADELEFIQRREGTTFLFDFDLDLPSWQTKPAFPKDALVFLRHLASNAMATRKHLFVVLADPRLLAEALQMPPDGMTGEASFKTFFKHLAIGCRVSADRSKNGVLPWLCSIPYMSRFFWITGPLDEGISFDDIRPCSDEVPKAGDYNLYTGEVYWAGTYLYRDSVNAFQHRYSPLTYIVFDFSTVSEKKDVAAMVDIAYGADRYSVSYAIFDPTFVAPIDDLAGEHEWPLEHIQQKLVTRGVVEG